MKDNYSFEELGEAISDFINESPGLKVGEVGQKVLGIHPTNVSKRLRSNNLKIKEVAKLAEYLDLEIKLELGPIRLSSNPSIDQHQYIDVQSKLIAAMEQVNTLQEELAEYKTVKG